MVAEVAEEHRAVAEALGIARLLDLPVGLPVADPRGEPLPEPGGGEHGDADNARKLCMDLVHMESSLSLVR
jgi:hypothetical protein